MSDVNALRALGVEMGLAALKPSDQSGPQAALKGGVSLPSVPSSPDLHEPSHIMMLN